MSGTNHRGPSCNRTQPNPDKAVRVKGFWSFNVKDTLRKILIGSACLILGFVALVVLIDFVVVITIGLVFVTTGVKL